MAVSIEDIKKLRKLTSAGLSDCKAALNETDGDMDAAVEILRQKGKAIAAKREDRDAAEGCVLAKSVEGFAAIVALKCETDFVAKNAGFVELTQKLLDLALANKVKSAEELNALTVDGRTVAELVVEESGKTGEKTEIGAYEYVEAPAVVAYNHFGNKLSTIVGFNKAAEEQVLKDVAMQVAAMNPVSVDRDSVPQAVKDSEYSVAIEKTKEEQVKKAVDNALQKAGYNLYICESEEHINEGIMKGRITEEDAVKIREIKEKVGAEKAANLPEQMVNNIANGRMNKFYKESCLMEQEFVKDAKLTIGQYLESNEKGLAAITFKRVNLNED